MKRYAWWNPRLGIIPLTVVLVVLHAVLYAWLARHDIVSSVFALGAHVPRWMPAVAAMFAVIRLSVIILVPGLLAWKGVLWVAGRSDRKATDSCASERFEFDSSS